VPVSAIVVGVLVEELLERVNWPVAAAAVVGSKPMLSVAVWPGVRVSGKVAPEIEKPVPVRDTALTVTAPVPIDVRVTDFAVAGEFKVTLPNATVVVLTPRVGTPA
jgi:hypothetical protein